MKQNREVGKCYRLCLRRVSFSVFWAALGFAIAAGMIGTAQGATVTVDGMFTTFASDIFDPSVRTSFANRIQLTSSGVVTGNNGGPSPINFYQSNQVSLNTTNFTFTYDPNLGLLPNSFEFIPAGTQSNIQLDQQFLLGTLRITNGQWYPHAYIGITLETISAVPAFNGHTFTDTIVYNSVTGPPPPLRTPVNEADSFYFLDNVILGSGRVYDLIALPLTTPPTTNVGAFGLWGHIGSLHLDRIEPLSGGFTTSSIGTGVIDPVFPQSTTPVPEPSTLLLLGSGLLAGAGVLRNKFKK